MSKNHPNFNYFIQHPAPARKNEIKIWVYWATVLLQYRDMWSGNLSSGDGLQKFFDGKVGHPLLCKVEFCVRGSQ